MGFDFSFTSATVPNLKEQCATVNVLRETPWPAPVRVARYHDRHPGLEAWCNSRGLLFGCLTLPQRERHRKCCGSGWDRASGNVRTRRTLVPAGRALAAFLRATRERERHFPESPGVCRLLLQLLQRRASTTPPRRFCSP